MGVALKRLSGWPNIAEIFVIDNKILDDEGILKNIKLQFLPKMGVVLPRPSVWPNITGKIWKILLIISYSMVKELCLNTQL